MAEIQAVALFIDTGVSRSLPASELQQTTLKSSLCSRPSCLSQSLSWQDGPESRHF
ncbi:hypothetical protein ACRRTK_015063 [Alexandromys fortis]